jgi:2-polyprenyl-3-methyl-5-hydroxy-6-metoxy-1,4-benzoquinol methylase
VACGGPRLSPTSARSTIAACPRTSERRGDELKQDSPREERNDLARYPEELVDQIRKVKGEAAADELARDLDPTYVELSLRYSILSYVGEDELDGGRLLDFGCGSGASTVVLARLFPSLAIVGVDLDPDFLGIAELRARHYGLSSVTFVCSSVPDRLPDDLGMFDYVMMSATYEHLLPDERTTIMRELWKVLRPGGVLFLNQAPHRWYPLEFHTTGLPLLNYLPAPLAHIAARRLSRRGGVREASWEQLERAGIRGATTREIMTRLPGDATLIKPRRLGIADQADLWYTMSSARRRHWRKPLLRIAYKIFHVTPNLNIAVQKTPVPPRGP